MSPEMLLESHNHQRLNRSENGECDQEQQGGNQTGLSNWIALTHAEVCACDEYFRFPP